MIRGVWVTVLAFALVGCRGLPTTHYYVLEPQHAAVASAAAAGWSVGIVPFEVDTPYDQDRIVYRVGEESAEVGYYAYHRWAAPLSRMLPRVVAAAFGDVAGISSIEPAAPGRNYDAALRGRVLALEEIDGPAGTSVRLVLELTLVGADDTVLWRDAVSHRSPAGAADDVTQVVTTMRAALNEMLHLSGKNLARTLSAP